MLEVRDIEVCYGEFQVLWGVSLSVAGGEVVCVLGPNGAGKSTVMNAVTGLIPRRAGSIAFAGEDLAGVPTHEMVGRGIAHVLERHRLFPTLTVRQNLILGAHHAKARRRREETLAWVEQLFPILRERGDQLAGSMSGGEQQLVAIARGLMSRPKLLMIDEPFLGLSPSAVDRILAVLRTANQEGVAVLFTEQNVQLALSVSHRGYVLESGRVALTGRSSEVLGHEMIRRVYLGL
ncbi:MAG TPA: ABC transporter ATP-binding protein [Burkholderiales bacterium]|jgi:branched-chain amino acid transport system ATP-binding protein